jgi:hypothetical protein
MAGNHLRWVPSAVASTMVSGGQAAIAEGNGKIRSIRLIEAASTHAKRIGEPEARVPLNTRFTRRVRLENSASRVWEFHPRAFDPPT